MLDEAEASIPAATRSRRFATWLALIAFLGFLLRVWYVYAMRHHFVGGDGYRYHGGALRLADGRGFTNPFNPVVPDVGHPPGWTILLAGPTKLFGLKSWLDHQYVTSCLGAATIAMVGVATRAVFGVRTALIAAALTAAYPFVWLYEREVVSEPLVMFFVATAIWLAYKFAAAPSRGLAVALGALVGVLAMTKSDEVAIGVVLVTPLILSPAVLAPKAHRVARRGGGGVRRDHGAVVDLPVEPLRPPRPLDREHRRHNGRGELPDDVLG